MLTLDETLRATIERDLQAIVGWPLVDLYRYGSQAFVFDAAEPLPDESYTDHAWILVAHQRWWIEGPNRFTLSDTDFEPERHDEHAAPFYDHLNGDPLRIERITLLSDGALRVGLSDGFVLAFVGTAEAQEERFGDSDDLWRVIPRLDSRGQIVLYRDSFGWRGLAPDEEAAT